MINTNAQHKLLRYFQGKHSVIVLYLSKTIEQPWIMNISKVYERENVRESEASPCIPTTGSTRSNRCIIRNRTGQISVTPDSIFAFIHPAEGKRQIQVIAYFNTDNSIKKHGSRYR